MALKSKRMRIASPSASSYERRVVAFVDILGFRSLLVRMQSETRLFEIIRDALESVNEYRLMSERAPRFMSGYRDVELAMSAFSDCYVISARLGKEILIVNLTRWLTLCLLEAGILCRGAIVHGPLYHKPPVVFGQGLVEAYELETSVAHYPRLVVANELVRAMRAADKRHGSALAEGILRDSDGCWFVDVFHIWPSKYVMTETRAGSKTKKETVVESPFEGQMMDLSFIDTFKRVRGYLVENLRHELEARCPNYGRTSKLRWLGTYFNAAMAHKRAVNIEAIDLDNPTQEEEWRRNRLLREGRAMRPVRNSFTFGDSASSRES